jgi:hypothetical protein
MLQLIGWVLLGAGVLWHFVPKFIAARAALTREKLEVDVGNEPLL